MITFKELVDMSEWDIGALDRRTLGEVFYAIIQEIVKLKEGGDTDGKESKTN